MRTPSASETSQSQKEKEVTVPDRRPRWDHSDNPTTVVRSGTWRAMIWIVSVIAFIGLLAAGIWAFNVATSDVKGKGDQTRIVNDARNRTNAQEWFHGQLAQIKAADKNLDGAAANLAAATTETDKTFWQTNLTGLRNRCNEMVASYNAETQKVSRAKWLDPALPYQIDTTDPTTDCMESK